MQPNESMAPPVHSDSSQPPQSPHASFNALRPSPFPLGFKTPLKPNNGLMDLLDLPFSIHMHGKQRKDSLCWSGSATSKTNRSNER